MTRERGSDLSVSGGTGIVAIGRNEGERLARCLTSLPKDVPAVYVDSDSSDDSLETARAAGIESLHIAPPPPLNAARARNVGFAWLTERHPHLSRVFFIDGDCVLDPGFLEAASNRLEAAPELAIVVGQLHEDHNPGDIYGRLAKLEWSSATGEVGNSGDLGGIMMVRVSDFQAVGGFDPDFIAGEDSELAVRLTLAGRKVIKIAETMAHHRMDMTSFPQWWRRSVRAGHALSQRYFRHGRSPLRDCRRVFFSTLAYGLALPVLIVLATALAGWPGLLLLLALAVPGSGFFRFYRGRGASVSDALTGAAFGIMAKFANALGLIQFLRNRAKGQFRAIEYK